MAVIGKTWLTVTDREGRRRLDHPDDAVRVEVETALHRDIPLIPVFLDNMQVPAADELPEVLRDLVTRNAIFVRPPPDFNHDIARLVQALERWLVEKVHGTDPAGSNAVGSDAASSGPPPAHPAGDEAIAPHEPPADVSPPVSAARGQAAAPDPARRPDPQPAVERRAPAPCRRIGLLAAVGLLAASGLGRMVAVAAGPRSAQFEFGDSYLFKDGDPKPANWQGPHHHMLGGGFKLPLQYVHWVVHVRHARHMPPAQSARIPAARRRGRSGSASPGWWGNCPTKKYPKSGQSEWIFVVRPRHQSLETRQIHAAAEHGHENDRHDVRSFCTVKEGLGDPVTPQGDLLGSAACA